ncbi:BnaA04g20860D [Brassica napus]|uniref:BnaA04g20860D protein n=1 Tax=Brassica napus TaxID=3708 RepID=A0A078HRT5_BRANA|nr:BnaA04g20860D [Brassica napus]
MVDIVVISDTIVRPESYEDGSDRAKTIHLTPWDLSFLRTEYAQRALIFPKPDPETHMISQLKSSLSAALKIFYPYAGRLVKTHNEDDETASFFIDCDGSGVRFVHAAAVTVSVSDVLRPDNDYWSEFFPANGVKSWEGVSKPLLAFQVTELKDGVIIGFGYNHLVTDGASVWSFFKTWTEIFSTGRKEFPPLSLCGWFLGGIGYPVRVPISETVPSPSPSHGLVAASTLQKKIFRFTSRHVSELKAKANGEVGGSDNVSSFQAVLGHTWRSIIRNSGLGPEEVIHCKLAMDIRQRLNPPVEKECFGNMVGLATTTTTAGDMVGNGLGWAALQINKTVGAQTNEELRRFAEDWVKDPKIPNRLNIHYFETDGVLFCPSLSPRFDVFGNDFGWGKPIAVRGGPGIAGHGKILAYPGTEKGSTEIHTSLWSHVLDKLLADEEFLQHVDVVVCV